MKTALDFLAEKFQGKVPATHTTNEVLMLLSAYIELSQLNEGRANKEGKDMNDVLTNLICKWLKIEPTGRNVASHSVNEIVDELIEYIESQHTSPIPELSDEEIERCSIPDLETERKGWVRGAKWYRDKIRSKTGQHNNK